MSEPREPHSEASQASESVSSGHAPEQHWPTEDEAAEATRQTSIGETATSGSGEFGVPESETVALEAAAEPSDSVELAGSVERPDAEGAVDHSAEQATPATALPDGDVVEQPEASEGSAGAEEPETGPVPDVTDDSSGTEVSAESTSEESEQPGLKEPQAAAEATEPEPELAEPEAAKPETGESEPGAAESEAGEAEPVTAESDTGETETAEPKTGDAAAETAEPDTGETESGESEPEAGESEPEAEEWETGETEPEAEESEKPAAGVGGSGAPAALAGVVSPADLAEEWPTDEQERVVDLPEATESQETADSQDAADSPEADADESVAPGPETGALAGAVGVTDPLLPGPSGPAEPMEGEWPTDEQERVVDLPEVAESQDAADSQNAADSQEAANPAGVVTAPDAAPQREEWPTDEQERVVDPSPAVEQTQQFEAARPERTEGSKTAVFDQGTSRLQWDDLRNPATQAAESPATRRGERDGGPPTVQIPPVEQPTQQIPRVEQPTQQIPRVEQPTQQIPLPELSEPTERPRVAQPQDFFRSQAHPVAGGADTQPAPQPPQPSPAQPTPQQPQPPTQQPLAPQSTQQSTAPPRPAAPEPRVSPQRRKRRVLIALSVLLVAALAGGIAISGPALLNAITGPQIAAPPPPVTLEPEIKPVGSAAPKPAPQGLAAVLDGRASNPVLGSFGGIVQDAVTGEVLWQRDAGRSLTPASTGKLITVSAALLALDHEKRFATKVVRGAEPGSVVLVGGGDPTLSALPEGSESVYPRAAKLDDLVAQVRAATGGQVSKIMVDSGRYSGPDLARGWLQGDVGLGFIAPIEPVMLDGARDDPTAKDSPRSSEPALDAGRALAQRLGVPSSAVSEGTAAEDAPVLGEVRSPTVRQLAEMVLRTSDNVLAETLAREVAIARGVEPSFSGATRAIRSVLESKGFDFTGSTMADGSGLSTEDRLTPRLLGALLTSATAPESPEGGVTRSLRDLLPGLPVAAGSGSLDSRYTDSAAQGWVRAKTGTLDGTNGLAGTVLTREGRLLVFALISNGATSGQVKPLLDEIAGSLRECGCR